MHCTALTVGQGTQFQLLVGPAFIYTFSGAALTLGLLLDRFNRPLLLGVGILLFSASCVLMGVASQAAHNKMDNLAEISEGRKGYQ